jgi:hypothetical protein
MKVDVGDLVEAGEVLVELDKENLAARLREARAILMGAEANFQAVEAELEKSEIEAEDVEVAFAQRNADRAELLLAEGLIGQQAFDDARSTLIGGILGVLLVLRPGIGDRVPSVSGPDDGRPHPGVGHHPDPFARQPGRLDRDPDPGWSIEWNVAGFPCLAPRPDRIPALRITPDVPIQL